MQFERLFEARPWIGMVNEFPCVVNFYLLARAASSDAERLRPCYTEESVPWSISHVCCELGVQGENSFAMFLPFWS